KGNTLHMSRNEGKSFNPVYTFVRKQTWQSCIYYHAPFNQVFVSSTEGQGISFSADYGETWSTDIFQPGLPNLHQVTSFAGTENGNIYAYSNVSNLTFVKTGATNHWEPITTISFYPTIGTN